MSRTMLSPKLMRWNRDGHSSISHWCPGCEHPHVIAVGTPFPNGAVWKWDGNLVAPTFSPSVNVGPGTKLQCHYFIRAGRIEYCGDCHHELAGAAVDLPDIPERWVE